MRNSIFRTIPYSLTCLSALLLGCNGESSNQNILPSTEFALSGRVAFENGTLIRGGEVQIRIEGSGLANFTGIQGSLSGSQIEPAESRTRCSISAAPVMTTGFVDYDGTLINEDGSWAVQFNAAAGAFSTQSLPICMFDPSVSEEKGLVFDSAATFQAQARMATSPEVCAYFCQGRETTCAEECARPGAVLTSTLVGITLSGQPAPPTSGTLNPGDPIPSPVNMPIYGTLAGNLIFNHFEQAPVTPPEETPPSPVGSPSVHVQATVPPGITSPVSIQLSLRAGGTLSGRIRCISCGSSADGERCEKTVDGTTESFHTTGQGTATPTADGTLQIDVAQWLNGEVVDSYPFGRDSSAYLACQYFSGSSTPAPGPQFTGALSEISGTALVQNPTASECSAFCPSYVTPVCTTYTDAAEHAYCLAEATNNCVALCTSNSLRGAIENPIANDLVITANIPLHAIVLNDGTEITPADLTIQRPEPVRPVPFTELSGLTTALNRIRIQGPSGCLQAQPGITTEDYHLLVGIPVTVNTCQSFLQGPYQEWQVNPVGLSAEGNPLVTLTNTASAQCIQFVEQLRTIPAHSNLEQNICDAANPAQVFEVMRGTSDEKVRFVSNATRTCLQVSTHRDGGEDRAGFALQHRACGPVPPAYEEFMVSQALELPAPGMKP